MFSTKLLYSDQGKSMLWIYFSGVFNQDTYCFEVMVEDLTCIQFTLNKTQPLIFIKVTASCAENLCKILKMSERPPEMFNPYSYGMLQWRSFGFWEGFFGARFFIYSFFFTYFCKLLKIRWNLLYILNREEQFKARHGLFIFLHYTAIQFQ